MPGQTVPSNTLPRMTRVVAILQRTAPSDNCDPLPDALAFAAVCGRRPNTASFEVNLLTQGEHRMQKTRKHLTVRIAAFAALIAVAASSYADIDTGYACRVQRIPTANTDIHGDFGYIRLYVHATPDCTGTATEFLVFLTNNATISSVT